MKKLLFSILFVIFIFTHLKAQNVSITYFVSINANQQLSSTKNFYTLLIKGNESVYFSHVGDTSKGNQYKTNYVDVPEERIKVKVSETQIVELPERKYEVFYKNYTKDSIIFPETIMRKKVIVGEKISTLFNWKIIPKSDSVILGYKCQKATTEFRGRKYVAYFNNKIAKMGGAWKFDGLPGVILYVRSEDDYFVIEPQKIIINKDTQKIGNYYVGKSVISWEEYINRTKEVFTKIIKRSQARNPDGNVKLDIKITDKIEDLGIGEMTSKK